MKRAMVTRVTKTEFELDDGRLLSTIRLSIGEVMEYKGYIIRQAFKQPVEQFNPISGHRWTIPGDLKKGKFNIIGPGMEILREFSLKGAKKHIDFLIKFKLNRPFHEMYGDRKQPVPERRPNEH